MPDGRGTEDDIVSGLYRWADAPGRAGASRRRSCSPARRTGAAREAAAELAEHYDVGAELWSATSYKALREEALAAERWNRLHPGQRAAGAARAPSCSATAPGPIVAVTDFMKIVPEQIARFVPDRLVHPARHRRHRPLATPARRCAASSRSTPATSSSPCSPAWPTQGEVKAEVVAEAIARYGIDPDAVNPAAP